MNYKKPIAIDLFSGCGGLTEGLKQAGFNVVAAVEINPIFVETYRLNHGNVKVWTEDIRNIKLNEFKRKLGIKKGQLDLLAGCPPCQGFSAIGTKQKDDKRNDLVLDFLRFIEALQPKAVMMENVPGLMKDYRMKTLRSRLIKIGYDCGDTPIVLNATDYGVPQRRKRMILLAGKKGKINLVVNKSECKTVRDTIAKLPVPGNGSDALHDYSENRTDKVMKIIKQIPKNGGSRRNLSYDLQLPCHRRCDGGFKDVYGRMKWDDVSPTITGGCTSPSKGRFLHPEQNRAITLREAALLQSFPSNYKFSLTGGKGAVSIMIGNALPPEFIRIHANSITKYLKENYVRAK
ncbi:DNA cytosine methyltransferase [Patescibacteria group bacterium]|nr:DNA cytosine methyltransferase [Candidatus Falkowbacteria bacterium]MBU3906216.1 DNA cytosine methyltransferase [Patescibacteria group bacterium]MCG2698430.1 DNA cytosine methyltransferase [Candidatus Parcubacteria bacterium]MBU4015380.1 DNA cytosine methyltransferase [Patescibacteria group bacterium]MBU4026811.1 DNA cytosine methyltransferase [Patescibacteria group bacterium]